VQANPLSGKIQFCSGGSFMGKYGESAILATHSILLGRTTSPIEGWEIAVAEMYPDSPSARVKGCPKNAYLGLCEAGEVKGIPAGSYTTSVCNKQYALRALSFLRSDPLFSGDSTALWHMVMNEKVVHHNGQMDVVLALWKKGLLQKL
jgi:Family of unknown function (DUF6979)